MEMMQLGDAVKRLASLDQEATIYAAQPWTSESTAVVAPEPETRTNPESAVLEGLRYFLEVSLACEFLEGWESTLGRLPSDKERCERLIRYAAQDA